MDGAVTRRGRNQLAHRAIMMDGARQGRMQFAPSPDPMGRVLALAAEGEQL